MRVRFIGAGVVSLAVASVVVSVAVAAVIFRDPVGDARQGWCTPHNTEPCPSSFGDITSVRVSQTASAVTVAVTLGSRCAGLWPRVQPGPVCTLVGFYVDSDRTVKTGVEHRYRGDPPAGTDFWMRASGRAGNAIWGDHDHNAATDDPHQTVPTRLWDTRVTPLVVTFTLARDVLANPPEGFGKLPIDGEIRYAVRSFQLMGITHDRSPDSGWHTYRLRRAA